MLEFQHLRGFQGLNYSLKFAESLTLDKLKMWYYGTIRRERKREKRERNERDKREPVSLPPSPLTLYGERKERVKKERRERKREYPHLGKNSAGDVYAVCADSAAGKAGRNSIYYYRHITPRIFSYLNNRILAI